mmetsp:Transcript_16262/g.39696  ORF Transcript_16262/g.39696 Transcript_16262/m.39696 type:complete len:203 (+) Transcript_16262:305-913(+)
MGEMPLPVAKSSAVGHSAAGAGVRSKPLPITGDTPTSAPAFSAHSSPAVPSPDLTRNSNLSAAASGAEATAMNAALPSTAVRICTNMPGVAYPLAMDASTCRTMECRPPSAQAGALDTTLALPHSKSFHPALVSTWLRWRRGARAGRVKAPAGTTARAAVAKEDPTIDEDLLIARRRVRAAAWQVEGTLMDMVIGGVRGGER